MKVKEIIQKKSAEKYSSIPEILYLNNLDHVDRVKELLEQGLIQRVSDNYELQLQEYFQVQNPTIVYDSHFEIGFQKFVHEIGDKAALIEHGAWVFYPWLSLLVHLLDEEAFFKVRTARNRNLINEKEQKQFYNATVGVAGLSVGNGIALAVILQGGARHIKLADPDILELSNLNRIRAGVEFLGLPKVEMAARQIYVLNPYAQVELFKEGLSKENIERFFEKLDVIVDEIDDLSVKYLIRECAKNKKIPLVMGADNGDNAVIDIERYDLDENTPFFQGRLGKISYNKLKNLDKFGIGKTITKHIGPENITERMQESLEQMGKTIVSWPQLGGAALLNGSGIAYCIRKIVNGSELNANRVILNLDEKFIPSYASDSSRAHRMKVSQEFAKRFGIS